MLNSDLLNNIGYLFDFKVKIEYTKNFILISIYAEYNIFYLIFLMLIYKISLS